MFALFSVKQASRNNSWNKIQFITLDKLYACRNFDLRLSMSYLYKESDEVALQAFDARKSFQYMPFPFFPFYSSVVGNFWEPKAMGNRKLVKNRGKNKNELTKPFDSIYKMIHKKCGEYS